MNDAIALDAGPGQERKLPGRGRAGLIILHDGPGSGRTVRFLAWRSRPMCAGPAAGALLRTGRLNSHGILTLTCEAPHSMTFCAVPLATHGAPRPLPLGASWSGKGFRFTCRLLPQRAHRPNHLRCRGRTCPATGWRNMRRRQAQGTGSADRPAQSGPLA